MTRFVVIYVAVLVVVLVGVRIALGAMPPRREAWNLVQVGADTSVMLLQATTASTGFYRDQLTVRFLRIEQRGKYTEQRAQYGPAALGDAGVDAGPVHVRRQPDGWTVRMGGTGVQVSGRLDGGSTDCPPRAGRLVGAMGLSPEENVGSTGAVRSEGGAVLDGPAVMVRTTAVGDVVANAIYILGVGVAIGVDPLAQCPAWAHVRGQEWTGDAPEVPGMPGQVQVGEWLVKYDAAGPPVGIDPWAHTHPVERFFAGLAGVGRPVERAWRIAAIIEGPGIHEIRTGLWWGRAIAG